MKKAKVLTVVIGILTALVTTPGTVSAVEAGMVQIHGFVSQGYLYSDDVNFMAGTKKGSAEFNEIGINFQTQPVERLRVGAQLFCRDLGDIGNNKVRIDWAMGDYSVSNELGIRIGIVKTPLGLSHDVIDLDMTRTTVFLPLAVYEPRYRDIYMNTTGVNFYGVLPLGPMGDIQYSAFAGNNSSFNPDALIVDYAHLGMKVDEASIRLQYGGRVVWNTPVKDFLVGGSFIKVEDNIVAGDMPPEMTSYIPGLGSLYPAGTRMVVDNPEIGVWFIFSQLAVQRLTITGEVHRMVLNSYVTADKAFDPAVAAAVGFSGFDPDYTNYGGWYAQMDYQFNNWFSAAATYSEKYSDWDDPNGSKRDVNWTGLRRDTTLSGRFDLAPNWNIKLEAHMMDGTMDLSKDLQEDPDDIERYWNLYAVKTSFYF